MWGDEQQKAFDEIKQYMKEPPVLVPPQLNKPFKCTWRPIPKPLDRLLYKNLKERSGW
jgi:hypothetical protein